MTDIHPLTPPESSPGSRDDGGGLLPALGTLFWLGATVALAWWSLRTPEPLPASAPANVGSAARAVALIEELGTGGDSGPMPSRVAGSDASAAARQRLVEVCGRFGLTAEIQHTTIASPRLGAVATVHNVVARVDGIADTGAESRHAICLMAHYDSVAAGPGVGDDLAGVSAILEATRALRARGGLQRDLILLFTDAEEQGLFGADAFVQEHPFADEVGVVINVEGRGASGPSRMFETGPGNGWSVAALSEVAQLPSATSVSAEIYRRMPNGTDFTVWIQRGVPGLNYAFIGDVHAYHTPLDGLDRLSLGSLQHHVDNVVDAVTALDQTPFPESGAALADAVFLDLPTGDLVHLSPGTARLIAGAALLLAVVTAALVAASRGVLGVCGGVLGALLALLVLPLGGHGARWALGALGLDALVHPAYATVITVAASAFAVATGLLFVKLLARLGLGGAQALAGAALVLAAGGFVLAQTVLGGAYLLVVPAAVLSAAGVLVARSRFADGGAALVGILAAVSAAVVWAPLHPALVDALGCRIGALLAAPLSVGFVALTPALVAGRGVALGWASGLCGLIALGAGGLVLYLPSTTILEPGQVSIVRAENGGGAEWRLRGAEPLREKYLEGLGERAPEIDFATHASDPLAGTRPALQLTIMDAGGVETTDGSRVGGTLRVVPRPGTTTLWLEVSGGQGRFSFNGVDLGASMRWVAPAGEGVELSVELERGATLHATDEVPGLGGPFRDAARPLLEARGDDLVPVARGDRSLVTASIAYGATTVPEAEDKR